MTKFKVKFAWEVDCGEVEAETEEEAEKKFKEYEYDDKIGQERKVSTRKAMEEIWGDDAKEKIIIER